MCHETLRVGDLEEDADGVESAGCADVCQVVGGFAGDCTARSKGDAVVWLRLWWRLLDRSWRGFLRRRRRDFESIVVLVGFLAERLLEFLHACIDVGA